MKGIPTPEVENLLLTVIFSVNFEKLSHEVLRVCEVINSLPHFRQVLINGNQKIYLGNTRSFCVLRKAPKGT